MRRLVCRSDDPRWKIERHLRVTASEAAAVLGRVPERWPKKRADVFAAKVAAEPDDWKGNHRTWWGSHDEPSILAAFAKMTGLRVRHSNSFYENGDWPGVGATTDAIVVVPRGWDPDFHASLDGVKDSARDGMMQELHELAEASRTWGRCGLGEAKLTEGFFGKEWDDGCPDHHRCQVEVQLQVCEMRWAMLIGRIGACDMRWRLIVSPGVDGTATLIDHIDQMRRLVEFRREIDAAKAAGG